MWALVEEWWYTKPRSWSDMGKFSHTWSVIISLTWRFKSLLTAGRIDIGRYLVTIPLVESFLRTGTTWASFLSAGTTPVTTTWVKLKEEVTDRYALFSLMYKRPLTLCRTHPYWKNWQVSASIPIFWNGWRTVLPTEDNSSLLRGHAHQCYKSSQECLKGLYLVRFFSSYKVYLHDVTGTWDTTVSNWLSHNVRHTITSVHLTHAQQRYVHLCRLWLSQLQVSVAQVGVNDIHSTMWPRLWRQIQKEVSVLLHTALHTLVNVLLLWRNFKNIGVF